MPSADPAVFGRANAVGLAQGHLPWNEEDGSSSRGIITHLSNTLGMLTNHINSSSSAREPRPFGLSKSRRKAAEDCLLEGGNLDIAHDFPANAEVA